MASLRDHRSPKLSQSSPKPQEGLTAMKNDAVFISNLARAMSSLKTQAFARNGDVLRPRYSQELAMSLLSLDDKEFLANPAQPGSPWGIRVVDETALIGGPVSVPKPAKIAGEKPAKRPRKRAARAPPRRDGPSGEAAKKAVYSREAMEALRFAGAAEQRAMWEDVHLGLGPAVRKEYDDLLVIQSKPEEKNARSGCGRARRGVFVEKKDHSSSPSMFGVLGGKGRAKAVDVSVN